MSKVIRVEDKTYTALDHLRLGRQTFDDTINNLLESRLKILELISILEGMMGYRQWQSERLQKIAKTV